MIRLIYRSFFLCLLLVSSSTISAAEAKVVSEVEAEEHDAFSWQNRKHFENQHQKFVALAEKEYYLIIDQTIDCIDKSEDFFRKGHVDLMEILQDTILDWLKKDVLTYKDYEKDLEAEEDGLTYEKYEKDPDAEFEQWKCTQLNSMLGIFVSSSDKLDGKAIDIDVIKRFLTDFVDDGYSWLINDEVNSFLADDFSERVEEWVGIPSDLVLGIFEGLWFDYDWEDVDIADPLFIAKTYKNTLEDLKHDVYTTQIKEYVVASVVKLFTLSQLPRLKRRSFTAHVDQLQPRSFQALWLR